MPTPTPTFEIAWPPLPDQPFTTQELVEWLQENAQISSTNALPGVISSTLPTSNIGIVIKDGLVYVWNDTTEQYVPLAVGPEIGEVVELAFTAIDVSRYVQCDGSAIPRVAPYSQLYAKIAVTFGIGDGTTTFNVPDLRQHAVEGVAEPTTSLGDLIDVGQTFTTAKKNLALVKAIRYQ